MNDKDVTGAETAMMRALHLCQRQTQKPIFVDFIFDSFLDIYYL